jgi:CRP/FNR family cyclic AMP-dependent transcriptional regulator
MSDSGIAREKTSICEGMRALKERFEGTAGRRLLIDTLKTQKMVAGNSDLAEKLAGLVEVIEVKAGETIIRQGASDNDMFFILSGSFSIVVNGKVVATRSAHNHVGEMSAIEPCQPRVATVVADENAVICKLSEPHLAEVGQLYPDIWRYFARELVRRLAQRNAFVTPLREHVRVFIISSTEALPIAREIQSHFEHDNFSVEIWTDGVFTASSYPIESLEKAVDDADFAIAIAQPDDLTNIRGLDQQVPRDNVIFELGIFIGRLGRNRTLLLEPRGETVKLPTDLSGLLTISYRYGDPKALPSLLGPACNRIRKIVNDLGPRI